MTMHPPRIQAAAVAVLVVVALAACGSSSKSSTTSSGSTPATTTATQTTSTAAAKPAVDELPAAEAPHLGQFPATKGRSLQQLANLVKTPAQFGAATGTFTPGTRRLAFAINASSGAFIYAPTAVYVASGPNSKKVVGPILAPADPTGVPAQDRSKQNAGPGGISAIYAAQIPLAKAGTYAVLSLTKGPNGLIGATGEVAVASSSPIPDVGQHPPDIATDTSATTHGSVALLTTRTPPESMHSVSFNQVLGKRPIALIFSTPQLCVSRVCGPVTDVLVSLQKEFQDKITFIHEEVYVANTPSKGLRPQMKAFHLQTEPWLFTINAQGVIVSRLEGAFGVTEARQALEAALK